MSIEDRLAISDLFMRYTTALDGGDVETVVDCFTADAALESPVIGVIAGRDAIRAFAVRFAAQRAGGTQFRHMITNIAAEISAGGDRARASAYLLVLITRDGKSRQPSFETAVDLHRFLDTIRQSSDAGRELPVA